MEILYVASAAFGGGIASAIMGWLDSGEVFIARKFTASIIRALVAGGVFAVGYTLIGGVTVMDIIIAFVAGAGVDVLGNRIAGSIRV
uniref:Uncharacterized protein n=1 Tax=viral metagenome TaxID=1070528 RepID=A0A6M3K3A2_9ZZZZ